VRLRHAACLVTGIARERTLRPETRPMNITMIKAGLLAGVLALGLSPLALAQPAPVGLPPPARTAAKDVARLDAFDFRYVLEWGEDFVQHHLKLTRQADGSYLADADGEGYETKTGVRLEAAQVADLLKVLSAAQRIPDDGFGGDGSHFYTQVSATGALGDGQPLSYERYYYDMSDSSVARLAGSLDNEVEKLVKAVASKPAPAPPAPPTPTPLPPPAPSSPTTGLSGSLPR
jgi:hypothetical protein